MATLQDAINIVRWILNDPDGDRWSDPDLLQYGNDALDAICGVMPHLFYTLGQFTCIPNTVDQTLSPADSFKFISIEGVIGGDTVHKTTVDLLNRFVPTWRSDDAGDATSWAPHDGNDPNRFYIYPKAPSGQVLLGKYGKNPGEWAAGDTHELASLYTPIIAEYIVYRALDRQTDDGDPAGSATHQQRFYSMLGVEKPNIIPTQQ